MGNRMVTWDADSVRKLCAHYEKAVEEGVDTFTLPLDGEPALELDTRYAGLLLEYLLRQINGK